MKKFKLFTTIASLCLAVALMAFGVYAATSAAIGVSSSIKFTVDGNIGGTLTVKSYSVASKDAEITESNTALETFTKTINATDASGDVDAERTGDDAKFDINNKFVVYVIKFEETTNEDVTLKITDIVLKKGETVINQENENPSIKVVTNDLTSATAAKDKTFKFAVQLLENLNATTTFTVEFKVAVTPSNA